MSSGPGGLPATNWPRPETDIRDPSQVPQEGRASKSTPQIPVPAWAGFGHSGTPSALRPSSHTQRPKNSRTWPFRSLSGPPLLTGAISLERSASGQARMLPPALAPSRRLPGAVPSPGWKALPPAPSPQSLSQASEANTPLTPAWPTPQFRFSPFWAAATAAVAAASRSPNARTWGGAMLRAGWGGGREAGRDSREGARNEEGAGSPLAGRKTRGVGRASPRREDRDKMLREQADDTSSPKDCALWARGGAERTSRTWRPRLPAPAGGCSPLPASSQRWVTARGWGDGGEGGKGADSPPPHLRGRRGTTSSPGVRPAPSGHLVLPPAVAGGGGKDNGLVTACRAPWWSRSGFENTETLFYWREHDSKTLKKWSLEERGGWEE